MFVLCTPTQCIFGIKVPQSSRVVCFRQCTLYTQGKVKQPPNSAGVITHPPLVLFIYPSYSSFTCIHTVKMVSYDLRLIHLRVMELIRPSPPVSNP